jgi:hypothetical protein
MHKIDFYSEIPTVRFWSKVKMTSMDCWEYLGQTIRGYGRFWTKKDGKKTNRIASRFAYEALFGEIPEGMFVCHSCDNPTCVRPSHLFLGTAQDNIKDMDAKGRRALGSNHGNSKLDENMVKEMKGLFGRFTQRQLARRYGVSAGLVGHIKHGRAWKHV